jgi:hypothetical protein
MKNKLGQRKIQVNLNPDTLVPDTDTFKFGRHTLIIKRVRERGRPNYHICVEDHPIISIEDDGPKEQLILKLIDQHRDFFALKEKSRRTKCQVDFSFPSDATSTATDQFYVNTSAVQRYSITGGATESPFKIYI